MICGEKTTVRWTVVSTKTRQNLHRWASLWRRRCEWRRWASSLHCRSGKRRNWSPRGRTISRPDPNSSEGHRSLPGGRTKEHVLETDFHHSWRHRSLLFLTHIASRHDVSTRTDHGGLDEGAPPVALAAHAVSHHGQQGLLQPIWHRPVGCGGRTKTTHISFIKDSVPTPRADDGYNHRLKEGRQQRRGDFTVKVAPAGDVTVRPGGENLPGLWETGHPHTVGHDGALVQLQQGEVVARWQTNVVRRNNNLHSDNTFCEANNKYETICSCLPRMTNISINICLRSGHSYIQLLPSYLMRYFMIIIDCSVNL